MLHCNVGNKLINRRPTQRNLLCLRVETLALFAVVLFGFGPTAGATIPVAPAVVVVVVTKHVPAEFWCPTLAIAFELTKVWVQALRETMDGEYFLCMTREHRVGVRCEHACMHLTLHSLQYGFLTLGPQQSPPSQLQPHTLFTVNGQWVCVSMLDFVGGTCKQYAQKLQVLSHGPSSQLPSPFQTGFWHTLLPEQDWCLQSRHLHFLQYW